MFVELTTLNGIKLETENKTRLKASNYITYQLTVLVLECPLGLGRRNNFILLQELQRSVFSCASGKALNANEIYTSVLNACCKQKKLLLTSLSFFWMSFSVSPSFDGSGRMATGVSMWLSSASLLKRMKRERRGEAGKTPAGADVPSVLGYLVISCMHCAL